MENKFVILSRYETFTSKGKEFTKWFVLNTNPMFENDCKEYIKNQKSKFGFIDQKTKLKHEYSLKPYEEYINEQNEIKKKNEELKRKHEIYLKSDEYKELKKKKRIAAKERKLKQEKYKLEHNI